MDPASAQPAAAQHAGAQPAGAFSAVPPPPPAATVAPGADGGFPTDAEVAALVSSTSITKRKRAGTHVVATAAAKGNDAAGKKARVKSLAAGPGAKPGVKRKRVVQRAGLPPPGTSSPLTPVEGGSDAQRVLDDMPSRY